MLFKAAQLSRGKEAGTSHLLSQDSCGDSKLARGIRGLGLHLQPHQAAPWKGEAAEEVCSHYTRHAPVVGLRRHLVVVTVLHLPARFCKAQGC